jgi:septum formation protein
MENSKLKFILASTSPRRKELIGHLKVPFEIYSLNVPEESNETDPVSFSQEISNLKGEAVFKKFVNENPQNNYFVVSSDTIVCLNGKIFGKPADKVQARKFLVELSGKIHSVFTAVSINLYFEGKHSFHSFVEETKVTFNPIPDYLLERYLDTGDSLDKAGAYGIQNGSLTFISKVDGDYSNVVGFPLSRFVLECEKFLKSKIPQEALWLNHF